MKFPQLNFSMPTVNKKMFMIIAAILVIAVALWAAISYHSKPAVDPDLLLQQSLSKTMASQNYRFHIECKLGNKQEPISDVTGERAGSDQIHIVGKLINSPVEFIQYKDNTYMKDPFAGKWLTLQGNQLAQAESFVIEFNPLANFNFKDVPRLEYLGSEELDGRETEVLELVPNIDMPFLENQFNVFKYKLWIDSSDQRIYKATINASHSANANSLMEINIKLWDYDQEINIQPPV
ncbi:hypothetical protein V6C27_12880 [Peptococcaceae bacterium 1198_IL3148]